MTRKKEDRFYLIVFESDGSMSMLDFRYLKAIWNEPEDCDATRNFSIGTVVP